MLHPRARTMLLLAIPALIIGVASSLVLIVVMKVASVLQAMLWTALPTKLGATADSPARIVVMLTLTGIAVGTVIRFSPRPCRPRSGAGTADWRPGSPLRHCPGCSLR